MDSEKKVLIAASLGFGVIQLDVSVVNVAVKAIGTSFGGGVTGLQWVVDAYTFSFAALILTAGALGDRLGARRMCLAGFAVFTAASAACGLAPALPVLIAARTVQGVGAAMLGACTLVLLSHAYPDPERRARAIGLWAVGASSALAAGPLAGGLLITAVGWRAIFFINLPLGAIGLWLTARHASETPRTNRALDAPGQALAIVMVAALAGAAIEAGPLGWASPVVLAAIALAIVSAVAFICAERRSRRPMLPLTLFGQRAFTVSVATGFAVNVAFYGLIFVVSLVLQRDHGFSSLTTGLTFVPVMAAIMAGNATASRLACRGHAVAGGGLMPGAALMAAGCAVMAGAGSNLGLLVAGLSLAGLGLGIVVPAITSAALGSVAATRSGIAAGSLIAFRQTGSVLGVAVCGTLLTSAGPGSGLTAAAVLGVLLSLLVLALGWLGRRGRKERRAGGREDDEHPGAGDSGDRHPVGVRDAGGVQQ
jgi:DHA2 family methylenomycin A resistance protein-like MFS transporter